MVRDQRVHTTVHTTDMDGRSVSMLRCWGYCRRASFPLR
jgi:hypothetical protein